MMVLCVDNAGIAAPNQSIIDDFVAELKELGFDLELLILNLDDMT